MLGTANFDAGPLMAFASGNLCYQIEHHLFPNLPSNRYAQIATRVRALCDKFDLPYTTGPLLGQYLQTVRTIHKLALPDRFLPATSDDAPDTASRQKVLTDSPATQFDDTAPPGRRAGRRTSLRLRAHQLRHRRTTRV
jgi:NADPH-dependent stearoyl-CoA 9-desaturase